MCGCDGLFDYVIGCMVVGSGGFGSWCDGCGGDWCNWYGFGGGRCICVVFGF